MNGEMTLRIRFGWTVRTWVAALAVLMAGCGSDPEPKLNPLLVPVLGEEHLVAQDDAQVQNCLFIILDTTHAPHSSAWGYSRRTTPNLDVLAEHDVRFDQTFTQEPATLPSALSYLTGTFPAPPPTDDPDSLRLLPEQVSLADAFSDAGFGTFGFSENPYISETWGFDQGFDEWVYLNPIPADNLSRRAHEATSILLDGAFESIESSGDDPWFTYLHLFRPHNPYLAPAPFDTIFMNEAHAAVAAPEIETALLLGESTREINRVLDAMEDKIGYMIASYDGNLAYVDKLVGEFLVRLSSIDALSDTVVIVASDHGEGFMQHGRIGHGLQLYEEQLHVLLIVWGPGIDGFTPNVVEQRVTMLDVFPTLAELFSFPARDVFEGQSLTPLLTAGDLSPTPILYSQTKAANLVSARIGNMKLIATTDPVTRTITDHLVFDLSTDPGERTNLYSEENTFPELVAEVERYIAKWPERTDMTVEPIPEDQLEQLRAVGYIE